MSFIEQRNHDTLELLVKSPGWKRMTQHVDTMRIAAAGPVPVETFSDDEHDMVRAWARQEEARYETSPLVLRAYFDIVGG